MSLALAGCAVVLFSVLSFWRPNPMLFMLAGGASLMLGLYWHDVYATNIGLSMGILLIAYGVVCLGFAFKCIFWRGREREEREE